MTAFKRYCALFAHLLNAFIKSLNLPQQGTTIKHVDVVLVYGLLDPVLGKNVRIRGRSAFRGHTIPRNALDMSVG